MFSEQMIQQKFDNVAAKAKSNGYFMVSGYDDAFKVIMSGKTDRLFSPSRDEAMRNFKNGVRRRVW